MTTMDVFRLVMEGRSDRQIAALLGESALEVGKPVELSGLEEVQTSLQILQEVGLVRPRGFPFGEYEKAGRYWEVIC